jgi:hypothetical protein
MSRRTHAPTARRLAEAALVAAALAVVVLPPLFGLAGIVLGGLAWRRGDSLGRAAAAISVVTTGVGLALGALLAR